MALHQTLAAPLPAPRPGCRHRPGGRPRRKLSCSCPGPGWLEVISQGWASLFYAENWLLQSQATNYYAADHSQASPFQHFWSLSIQGQVFILWPLIFAGAAIVAKRFRLRYRVLLCYIFAADLRCFAALLNRLHPGEPDGGVLRHLGPAVGVCPGHAGGFGPSRPAASAGLAAGAWLAGHCGHAQLRPPAQCPGFLPRVRGTLAHPGGRLRHRRRAVGQQAGRRPDPQFEAPGPAGRHLVCPVPVALAGPGHLPCRDAQGPCGADHRRRHRHRFAGARLPHHPLY